MDSLDKLIGVSETYWHAHPDDERAFQALGTAYNNAAIIDDPRLSGAEATRRAGIRAAEKADVGR